MEKSSTHFDYIIIGAGLAGLSLAHGIIPHLIDSDKRLLILDKALHSYPERTWSFWEVGSGAWDSLVQASWRHLRILDHGIRIETPIAPYCYKSIASDRWRAHYLRVIAQHQHITLVEAPVTEVMQTTEEVTVHTQSVHYTTPQLFDSRFDPKRTIPNENTTLWQQFYGCYVRTEHTAFDPNTADLMDFRADQQDHVAFFYVLPSNSHTALIEYTLFTARPLDFSDLKRHLSDYLDRQLGHRTYEILRSEEGNIPMSSYRFPTRNGRIISIGTAGGCTKPSSGYTFHFIQQQVQELIRLIEKGKLNTYGQQSGLKRRFHFYDRILLQILADRPERGHAIFVRLFQRNQAHIVLKFLNNDTHLGEEIKLFTTLPILLFSRYALRLLWPFN